MSRSPTDAGITIALGAAVIGALYLGLRPAFHVVLVSGLAVLLFALCLKPDVAQANMPRAAAVGLGMPLLAWALPHIGLLYAATGAITLSCAPRLERIAPTYLFAFLLLPGLDTTFAIGSLKLFEFGVHDALAFGGAAAILLNGQRKPAPARRLDLPVAALLLVLAMALGRDTTITNLLRTLLNVLIDLALPYYVVSRSVRTTADVQACMLWLGCAGAILAAVLLYEVFKGWPMYNVLHDRYGVPALLLVKARGGVLRAGGPFLEATSVAMMLTTCIMALWLSRPAFRSGLHHGALMVLLMAGMSAPQSRGAWIGLILGFAAGDLYRRRLTAFAHKLGPILLIGGTLYAAAALSPALSETLGLSGGSADTADYRRQLLDRGLQEAAGSPLWGFSTAELNVRLADLRQGEGIIDYVNTYIWILLISGVIGVCIFLYAFLFFLVALWRRRITADPAERDTAAFVFTTLVIPMEMLFFTSFGGRTTFIIFCLFGLGVAILRARPQARASLLRPAEAPAR